MATAEQLIAELSRKSHTYGWGAVVAFDSAVVMPMLAEYYAPMIHGRRGAEPISGVVQPFQDLSIHCTLSRLMLGAPRLSLMGGMQDSKLILTYDLRSGSYNEIRTGGGGADKVDEFINIEMSRTYTLIIEIDLATCSGTINKDGVVQLNLSAGNAVQCNLGSTAAIREKVGLYLLDIVNSRMQAGGIWLGMLKTERRHSLPKAFMLRAHAKQGGGPAEFALVMFVVGPDNVFGTYPAQSDLPYLIPDDVTDSQRNYSATVLAAPAYTKLGAEVTGLIGQLLFPNLDTFQVVKQPLTTRDVVIFGRLQPLPKQQRIGKKSLRGEPGVTSLLLTRSAADRTAIALLASTTIRENWDWELPSPGLGELAVNGVEATYVPPAGLPEGTKIVLQRIIASNRTTRERYEVCVVITAGDEVKAFSTPMEVAIRPGGFAALDVVYSTSLPFQTTFTVLGEGSVQNATYSAPSSYQNDIEVVIAEFSLEFNGQLLKFAEGYCIIQLASSAQGTGWTDLTQFNIEAVAANARVFANGLQQFHINVSVKTADNEPGLSEEEWASLRLVSREGEEIERIHHTMEALLPGAGGALSRWGWTDKRNDFNPAVLSATPPDKAHERAEARTTTLYLQTTDSLPKVFALRLTDRYGVEHTSNKPSQDEKRVLTVTPEPVPYRDKDNYLLTVYRADGLWDATPPNTGQWSITNPNYDWYAQSLDYWSLSYKFQNVIVPFVRVLWDKDGPGAQWASKNQQQEEAFAYIGYRLITGSEPIPSYLKFSSKLYDPILYNTEPPTLAPPNALLDDTLKGSTGSLLLSLHRVMKVFYSQKALIPGFDLEDAFEFTLWDANGNQHHLKVVFIEGRDKLDVLPQ